MLILSIWSRPSCSGAGATSGITRPERCARSSTAKVARGSAQIIQQSGSAILPICPAVDERVGRGRATPRSGLDANSRSWREISYLSSSPKGDRGFESCPSWPSRGRQPGADFAKSCFALGPKAELNLGLCTRLPMPSGRQLATSRWRHVCGHPPASLTTSWIWGRLSTRSRNFRGSLNGLRVIR